MKKKWKIIAYNLIILFVVLGGLEWYLNTKLNDPRSAPKWLLPALRSYYHERHCNIIQQNPEYAQYDSTLFYTLRPGTFKYENLEFSTTYNVNRKGVRDDEESLNYPKILVLGDSYSMGWGVEQDATYASILERKIGVKILNTAISSYGTAREITSLEKFKTDSVEYVIIQYCPNDYTENKNWVRGLNELHVSSEETYNTASELHLERNQYYFLKHVLNIPGYLGEKKKYIAQKSTGIKKKEKVVTPAKAFLSILKSSKKIPASAKIILFNMEAERSNNAFITDVKNLLDLEYASSLHDRLSYIDFTGKINDKHRFVLDPHLNAGGHQVLADEIYKHIDAMNFSQEQKVWLYETGDTSVICDYKNGVKDGVFKTNWENNQRSMITIFKNGSKEGIEQFFDKQGKLTMKRTYIKGKLEGWEITYNSDGSEKERNFYVTGEIVVKKP